MVDFERLARPGVRELRAYDPGHDLVALRRRFAEAQLVELGSNENPYGASPQAREAIQRALAAHHGVQPANLLLGNGSHELLMQFAQVFAGPGDEVVASKFGFAVYALAAQAAGATLRPAPALPRENAMPRGHDLAALRASIGPRTKLVYLANPNNPTGTWYSADIFEAFIASVPADVIVVVDEAYAEYSEVPSATALFPAHENIAVLRTLSKAHALAAARVGCVLGAPELIDALRRCQAPYPMPQPVTNAALKALTPQALASTAARVAEARGWRERLAEGLRSLPQVLRVYPSAGNFLLVRFIDADAAFAQLLEAGVVVRDMRAMPQLGDALRISVGTPDECRRVLAALDADAVEVAA